MPELDFSSYAAADLRTAEQQKAKQQAAGILNFRKLLRDPLLRDIQLTGFEDDLQKRIKAVSHVMAKSKYVTLAPLLPLLLHLKGAPYTLQNHFPFEPFFMTRLPRSTLLKAGRQVSKSTSLAAQGVLSSNSVPNLSTLYVTPLFEMIRRFSQNYVRPFIDTSPLKSLFLDQTSMSNVLQRSFRNQSVMHFSFAFLDAERTRGISADRNSLDEIQDIDKDFLPIIHETMSASEWAIKQYAGTPKTLENTIEVLWSQSSQAEWFIRCPHGGCRHWNIPALEYDLVKMIGPWSPDISEKRPGTICAKCLKPINARTGRWVHRFRDRRWTEAGFHFPQIIFPMHYADPEKWEILLAKKAGKNNTPQNVFFNEVCGESYDSGARMVTVTDLQRAACLPWDRDLQEAQKRIGEYTYRVVAVDWGGGGGVRGGVKKHTTTKLYQSYTSAAVLGLSPQGTVDVLWGIRSLHPHEHVYEAKLIMGILREFQCSHVVHDYTGAGARQETIMVQAGFPYERLIPVAYTGPAKGDIFSFKEATDLHPRAHYQCDKARSLGFTCQALKCGKLRFYQYDHRSADDPGLLWDFLALVEEKSEMGAGRDVYKIVRDPSMPDDFAQAVNIGVMALCHVSGRWLNVTENEKFIIPADLMSRINPVHTHEWVDM